MPDGHDHPFDHDPDHHGHDHALEVIEEPLDPANQSLADALRASFRVLKWVMLFLLIAFVFSGMVRVDNKEVVVLSRFGRQHGAPLEPGLHFALPYPIDSTVRVPTSARTIEVDAFWLRLSDADKTKPLDSLSARGGGLDPAVDGALLTGDRAIMHLLLEATYRVTDANAFVRNVKETEPFLQTIIQQAAIAEAARTTADVVWKKPGLLAAAIGKRVQERLNALESGITIDNMAADASHYPLQVKDDFIRVSEAENGMLQAIQDANKKWEEKVKGVAGPAWEELMQLIGRLDGATDAEREKILQQINTALTTQATGEASSRIQKARAESDRIVADAVARSERFKALLEAYRKNPELVRQRLRQDVISQVFTPAGISRWVLPEGVRNIWLNKDPDEIRAQAEAAIRAKAEGANR